MNSSFTVVQLAEIVGGTVRGDGNVQITGVSDVVEATPEVATWITSTKFVGALEKSRAGAVLVPTDFGPTPMPAILCERVDRSVAKLLGAFSPPIPQPPPGIHPSAVVDENAQIGLKSSNLFRIHDDGSCFTEREGWRHGRYPWQPFAEPQRNHIRHRWNNNLMDLS